MMMMIHTGACQSPKGPAGTLQFNFLMTINGHMARPIGFQAALRWEVVSLHGVRGKVRANAECPHSLHIYHSDMLTQSCRAPGGHDPHWEDASEHWACQHHNLDSGGRRWICVFPLLWLMRSCSQASFQILVSHALSVLVFIFFFASLK